MRRTDPGFRFMRCVGAILALIVFTGSVVVGGPATATGDGNREAVLPPSAPAPAPASASVPAKAIPEKTPIKKAAVAKRSARQTVARSFAPPAGETRFRRGEILVTLTGAMPRADIDAILRRHRLAETEVAPIVLLRTAWRLWRITDGRDVGVVLRELGGEDRIASSQPNYVYALQQDSPPPDPPAKLAPQVEGAISLPQYTLAKLHVNETQAAPPAHAVLVAVIDTAIDEAHPDLAGAIEARFDAIGGDASARTLLHGTSIAGAIAAHGQLRGVAPHVRILSARAFDRDDLGPSGTTLSILKSVDWAAGAKAHVINMSFAGPPDPGLSRILDAAFAKGLVLVGAAGNAGHTSPPLYPAADAEVIAVTAIDADDRLYAKANTGAYIAVSAPGVDVLLPTPNGTYDLQSGTSVSAALVSGVVALVLERRPKLSPDDIRKLLTATAKPLGSAEQRSEFGAGLVDVGRALSQTTAALPTQ